jgi:hypothetical protein
MFPASAGGHEQVPLNMVSDEDVTEPWLAAKSEAINKVRRTKGGAKGAKAHSPDVKEVEKTFWLSRPDGWIVNSGESAYTHLRGTEHPGRRAGMGGGSSISSGRTAFGQGKRVVRDHEDVWDKRRGRKKNHLWAR